VRVVCKEQNTPEWRAARAGKVTASRVAHAMARLKVNTKNGQKGDWAAAHRNYVSELAWELITGMPADHYVSKPMDIGTQFEGEARVEYWMRFGTEVDETGFVLHPKLDWLGSSPDGLVGTEGGVEIKVPLFHTHCGYLESDKIPDDYSLQMYTNMLCCERQWWDFTSYCPPDVAPEMPDEFRLFRKRLEADPVIFEQIEEAATQTIEEAVALAKVLCERYPAGVVKVAAPRKPTDDYDPTKPFAEQCDFLDNTLAECP
jgi:hypothetical protein